MEKHLKNKINLILSSLIIIFTTKSFLKIFYEYEKRSLTLIINMKNLTEEKHLFFNKIINEINSTRNYYFIKTNEKPLIKNLNKIVGDSNIKIIQSNFPDSIYLPLVVSLFDKSIPDLILFIEGEDLTNYKGNDLKNWYNNAFLQIINNNNDYIFGNSQFIEGNKIGCSLMLAKATIIQHLLYYTDSDTTHINPLIQLSLANDTKFEFIPFNHVKISKLENTHQRFSIDIDCPSIVDHSNSSLCIILPAFKRNYFSYSFRAFSNQTYKSKFYVIIQNDNRTSFNLTYFQKLVKEPIYHIWMQNFNSFFFLTHRLSSVFPCDFILKYDDDQWPIDNYIQEKLINKSKNKNFNIGGRGYFVNKSFRCYRPNNIAEIEKGIIVDHIATPFITRPSYLKLDGRNKIYSLYHAEDVSLSINCWKLCNVTSIYIGLNLVQKHNDGNNKELDEKNKLIYYKEKDVFENSYKYLIDSGYKPKKLSDTEISPKKPINITILHKSLNKYCV